MYGWTHELVALLANYGSILYIVAFLPMVRLLYCTVLYCSVLYCTVLYRSGCWGIPSGSP